MTTDELKSQLSNCVYKYEIERRKILRNYAMSNNPYKIGDLVKDHQYTIRIKDIKFSVSENTAECVFMGVWLKKDGTPNKKEEVVSVYQSNIIP